MHGEDKLVNLLLGGKVEALQAAAEEIVRAAADTATGGLPLLCPLVASVRACELARRPISPALWSNYLVFMQRANAAASPDAARWLAGFLSDVAWQICVLPQALSLQLYRDYIDAHFTEPLSLKTMARRYHTSPQYMSRLLRRELGVSFQTYLANLRINKARRLLRETTQAISVVYRQVGFANRNTFIRLFRLSEGVTPSEYRRLWLGRTALEPAHILPSPINTNGKDKAV